MSDVERLELLLMKHWNIRPTRIHPLSTGHTNKTYRIDCASRAFALRVSWSGKLAAQVRREASMLDHLSLAQYLPALPRVQLTVDRQSCVRADDGSWLHLFAHIDGTPGLPSDAEPAIVDAMRTLAHLHAAMVALPASTSDPLAWLNERYARVSARPAPALKASLLEHYALLLRRIGVHIAAAAAWVRGPVSWLHGDYHAGNLLFIDSAVSGVLDFDDVGQGAHWLETAFALFALARDASIEARFTFDVRLWDTGLRAYMSLHPGDDDASVYLRVKRDALRDLFCVEQVLIHLEAAQRGLWIPGPGMGFLACRQQLLADVLTVL